MYCQHDGASDGSVPEKPVSNTRRQVPSQRFLSGSVSQACTELHGVVKAARAAASLRFPRRTSSPSLDPVLSSVPR